ncbi:MAG TPA: hypothetical protein PL151_07875 [Phycisphaerae bacterium]|nr:hypothetical protein [Phycisphaerae bacterium]HOJ73147.1 hypothetical protein [Phycisphaerae bacterium]HOM52200.1 hypothetical protein [Phycisphaerae bacterium]HON65701.1 hypothetical protein [Phycisphaerae bacterium]HPP25415.1 hypothetical protein [Phycisphaerae bacterium]
MTTITKVFVILVCLFALIFTPLAIQFAARSYNWKATSESLRDKLETAYANERSAYAVAASEIEYYQDLLQAERNSLQEARKRISDLEQQLQNVTQERNQYAASRDNWERSATLLTNQLAVESERNDKLAQAREDALARERELRTQNLQLADRVKDLTAEVAILDQQNRQRVQELASFREENQKLRDALKMGQGGQLTGTATPTALAAMPVAAGPVTGEVSDVSGPLATLNIGSASGLRQGMILVVTRGGNYICDLEVTSNIGPNEAVGRIMYEEPGRRIRVGDKVQDATSFETRR